ncbi:hypothetical protein D0Y65_037898, partial [Glycine soja]
ELTQNTPLDIIKGKERSERLRGSRAVNSCPNFEKALLRTKTQYILHPKSLPIFLLKGLIFSNDEVGILSHYPCWHLYCKTTSVKLTRYVCTMMELCVLQRIIECFYFMDIWGNIISLFSFPVP